MNDVEMGAGLKAMFGAVLWQAFHDCKNAEEWADRLSAKTFLFTEGFEFWDALGLPAKLFDAAMVEWLPSKMLAEYRQL